MLPDHVVAVVFAWRRCSLVTSAALSSSQALSRRAVTKVRADRLSPFLRRLMVHVLDSSASGGSYKRANTNGTSVTVKFNGTYLAWIATKGTTLGKPSCPWTVAQR